MLVADVIKTALEFLDRTDVSELLDNGGYAEDDEASHMVKALLHCYNAVEDELARGFFPLVSEETFDPQDGRIYFEKFSETPSKILSVEKDGKPVKYRIRPKYIIVAGNGLTVRYEYCPQKKTLDADSDYGGYPVGERLLAYGIAAEYCLIAGATEESECWESRYKQEIARLRPYQKARKDIPARSWI